MIGPRSAAAQAESVVLSAVLSGEKPEGLPRLAIEDFGCSLHRIVWAAVTAIHRAGRLALSVATVCDVLETEALRRDSVLRLRGPVREQVQALVDHTPWCCHACVVEAATELRRRSARGIVADELVRLGVGLDRGELTGDEVRRAVTRLVKR